jgi:hypothetical protein
MSDPNKVLSVADEQRLELTLSTRQSIITGLTKDGKLPEDQGQQIMLMQALDGMDRTIMQRAKLKSDDAANKTNADVARLMGDLLLNFDPRKVRVRASSGEVIDGEAIPIPEMVPGEQDIGTHIVDYDSIVNE